MTLRSKSPQQDQRIVVGIVKDSRNSHAAEAYIYNVECRGPQSIAVHGDSRTRTAIGIHERPG
jgi:hypothetical protein